MAKQAIGTWRSQPMVSARASRSGERYKSRKAPCVAARITACCCSGGNVLLSRAPGMPISESCATWSCISAISGEITTTVWLRTSAGSW